MKKIYIEHHLPSRKWRQIRFVMKIKLGLLLCFVSQVYSNTISAQQPMLDVSYKNTSILKVLEDLKTKTGYTFLLKEDDISENVKVSASFSNATLDEVLRKVLTSNGYDYSINGKIIVVKKAAITQQRPSTQTRPITVKGTIVDDKGNPIAGATIVIHGTQRGIASDAQGKYSITANPSDVLRVTFIGYKEEIIPIKGRTTVDVVLNPTAENIQEVVVTAYGEQKKESVVSAITTVRAGSLKTSSSDLTSSFAGRVPGIIGWQTGGLPGALTEGEMNTKFYIRGITSFQTDANIDPLILLDGVESSKLDLARIDPEDIDSFSVLKDATATAMYGARGGNGVIIVTTKKGAEGSVYTSLRYETIVSMPTRDIDVVDPVTWMKMYNQALVGRDQFAAPKYSAEKIQNTGSDRFPSFVYPANDWYNTLFKQMSINHHMGLNIRGGSKIVQYYASLNHNRDTGMLKADKLNQFDPNIRNNSTSFRLNLNIDLNKGIKLVVNSFSTLDKYHGPVVDVRQAYYLAFTANPVDFAPTYPKDSDYNWPHIRFGSLTWESNNPYLEIQKGYNERSRYSTINRVEYIQNLSSMLKGLEFRANVSLSQAGYYNTIFETIPARYSLRSYDQSAGEFTLSALNEQSARRTLSVDRMRSGSTASTQVASELKLLHNAVWGDHTTSYTAVLNAIESTATPVESVMNGLPYRNIGLSMRLSYGYKERYYMEVSFGYNGSERFDKKNKMGFFPSVGGAWIVSKEQFMQPLSSWVSLMKLRLSYGKVGNDGIINNPRFVYIPDIRDTYQLSPKPRQDYFYGYGVAAYGNPGIRWEIAEQVNAGLELALLNGMVDFTIDAYQEIRHNILGQRTVIPVSIGLGVAPLDNIGKVRSRGIDFAGKIQKAITPNFWFILNGTLTYNQAKFLAIEEAFGKADYQWKVGHEISQQVGYIADGLFQSWEEIESAPYQGGDVMPGDIRYRDLDGDGAIDVNDVTYIGFPETPRLIYGINGFINYKGFEFSITFQGSGRRSFFINPQQISPFDGDRAMLTAIYNDHWSADNMKSNPLWPRLSTNNIYEHNAQEDWYGARDPQNRPKEIRKSTYFMREGQFIRCQSIEIGYNLPKDLINKWRLKNVKLYARTNNPFVISDFKLWDIELGESGFNYPIQKTYSVGLNVTF